MAGGAIAVDQGAVRRRRAEAAGGAGEEQRQGAAPRPDQVLHRVLAPLPCFI